ncbi:hypothetical protein AGLY_016021 [Aphis glycines]|uniref:Uncharacterized protein n=1 Tax=Aphis glycines TaxID=307491 RepID=A0A6G0SYR3_APHGL|nr:hypothetical protein AGLY_016021 [Aphis glycines]
MLECRFDYIGSIGSKSLSSQLAHLAIGFLNFTLTLFTFVILCLPVLWGVGTVYNRRNNMATLPLHLILIYIEHPTDVAIVNSPGSTPILPDGNIRNTDFKKLMFICIQNKDYRLGVQGGVIFVIKNRKLSFKNGMFIWPNFELKSHQFDYFVSRMILVFGTLSIFGSYDTVNKYSGTTRTNHQEERILYNYIYTRKHIQSWSSFLLLSNVVKS